MRPLSKFTSHQELLQMTDELFNVLDVDHSGAISFAEALAGLKRLRVSINGTSGCSSQLELVTALERLTARVLRQ